MYSTKNIIVGLNLIIEWINHGHKIALIQEEELWNEVLDICEGALKLLKRQQGKWTECTVRGSSTLRCSVCGCDSGTICESSYCPNCGAKMEERAK